MRRPSLKAVLTLIAVGIAVVVLIAGVAWDRHRTIRPVDESAQPAPPPTSTTSGTATSGARGARPLTVIGDSYSQAPGTDGKTWWQQLAARRGVTPKGDPVGGTGYCAGAEKAFRSQVGGALTEPSSVIVVAGSRNDVTCPDDVRETATEVFTQLKAGARGARIVVIGPLWDSTTPNAAAKQADLGAKQAAQRLRLTYIDALDAAWLGGHPELIDTDGVHPNPQGVDLLSRSIEQALVQAGVF